MIFSTWIVIAFLQIYFTGHLLELTHGKFHFFFPWIFRKRKNESENNYNFVFYILVFLYGASFASPIISVDILKIDLYYMKPHCLDSSSSLCSFF